MFSDKYIFLKVLRKWILIFSHFLCYVHNLIPIFWWLILPIILFHYEFILMFNSLWQDDDFWIQSRFTVSVSVYDNFVWLCAWPDDFCKSNSTQKLCLPIYFTEIKTSWTRWSNEVVVIMWSFHGTYYEFKLYWHMSMKNRKKESYSWRLFRFSVFSLSVSYSPSTIFCLKCNKYCTGNI